MLSEQDKQDMLADAHSIARRNDFRRIRVLQESRRPTLFEYCQFCESLEVLFPQQRTAAPKISGNKFLL